LISGRIAPFIDVTRSEADVADRHLTRCGLDIRGSRLAANVVHAEKHHVREPGEVLVDRRISVTTGALLSAASTPTDFQSPRSSVMAALLISVRA